jgi:hypothetical protein
LKNLYVYSRGETKFHTKYKETSYVTPVERENENILSFVKTTNYKTVLILGTPLP